MTDWPATVAPKWAIARNHAATVEEDAIREAPVVPPGGQAGRWQAITDTTTIESSIVDLKEKGLFGGTLVVGLIFGASGICTRCTRRYGSV